MSSSMPESSPLLMALYPKCLGFMYIWARASGEEQDHRICIQGIVVCSN
jgi:hypothetical protein